MTPQIAGIMIDRHHLSLVLQGDLSLLHQFIEISDHMMDPDCFVPSILRI